VARGKSRELVRGQPAKAEQPATHVDLFVEQHLDAGSIPAASTSQKAKATFAVAFVIP
jgi:hypothetical protein